MRSLIEPAPENAEAYKTLKFARSEVDGRPYAKAWRGKGRKPYANYYFRTIERREEWITEQKADADSREEDRANRAKARAVQTAEMAEKIQVGTILHYSWGYDQTQCEYFQVIIKKSRTVTICRIASETVEGSENFMSDRRRPVPDRFVGEPVRKRIGAYGISFSCGSASPTEPDKAHYCSWYA